MTESIEQIFGMIAERHPTNAEEKIGAYIEEYERTYHRYQNLISIEILFVFRKQKGNANFHKRFKDIYKKYGGTNFMVKKLSNETSSLIAKRYIDEMWNYRKEFCNAIQQKESRNRTID